MKYAVFMCCTIKILISSWPWTQFSKLLQAGKRFWLLSPWSQVGQDLPPIFLCSDWSKFDRWVHAENLCSILKLVYFDSWSWQSFVSTCDVFNCLVYWVLVEKCVACQSRKSDFGWYRFRFSPFLMRKRVKKSRTILALLDSFQDQHSEWQAWVIIVFDVCFFFI